MKSNPIIDLFVLTISITIINVYQDHIRVYSIIIVKIYRVFNNTLFDNCKTMYIINDISFLDNYYYTSSYSNDLVKTETINFCK